MMNVLKRWKIQTEDRLKYSPTARRLLSSYQRWRTPQADLNQQKLAESIQRLCGACRLASDQERIKAIERQVRERITALDYRRVDWSAFVGDLDNPLIPRSVVLKPWLGAREKGVVFISFERDWFKLLVLTDLKAFSERYDLVLAPSGDPHNLLNCVFAANFPARLFSLISNSGDSAVLPRITPNLVVVPLFASHWVLPSLFAPRPLAERKVDLTMVANFAKFKRHYALFSAMRRMSAGLRVRLIGQNQDGRTAETIRHEAAYFGVADRLEIESNAPYARVANALCETRASLVLSRREGSCVAVAESLFAGAPAAVLAQAEMGSRAFINDRTGVLLQDHSIASQLDALVHNAASYSPRAWAEEQISCYRSSKVLNDLLRKQALADGREWSQDIATLCWRPDPALVDESDEVRMRGERALIKEQFGVEIGRGG